MGGRNSKHRNAAAENAPPTPRDSVPGDSVRGFSKDAFDKPEWALDNMANESTKAAFLSQLHEIKLGAVLKAIPAFEYGMFWKANDHGEMVWETSQCRSTDPKILSFIEASRHCIFKAAQGLVGSAKAQNKTIWVEDAAHADTRVFERNQEAMAAGVASVVVFNGEGGIAEFGLKKEMARDERTLAQAMTAFNMPVDPDAIKAGVKPWNSVYGVPG